MLCSHTRTHARDVVGAVEGCDRNVVLSGGVLGVVLVALVHGGAVMLARELRRKYNHDFTPLVKRWR